LVGGGAWIVAARQADRVFTQGRFFTIGASFKFKPGHDIDTFISKPAILQADGLCFSYPGRVLFDNLSFRILPGLTWVRGGDGRGKSTLLRLLAGVQPADRGELSFKGLRLADQPRAYRENVFWMEPRSEAFDQLTPQAYFDTLKPQFAHFDAALLETLMEGFSLAPHREKSLFMLSTGSKRKVWLAGAIASGAELILLDDPFAALDKPSINFVWQLLAAATQQTSRTWVVSHYEHPEDLALTGLIDLGD